MHTQDSKFLDCYKSFEKLLSDMYSEPHGVTAYIDDMELHNLSGQMHFPNWNEERHLLKRLRRIRNCITHEENPSGSAFSTEEDRADLVRFHNLILKQEDPLSALRKAEAGQKRKIAEKPSFRYPEKTKEAPKFSSGASHSYPHSDAVHSHQHSDASRAHSQSKKRRKKQSNVGPVLFAIGLFILLTAGIIYLFSGM